MTHTVTVVASCTQGPECRSLTFTKPTLSSLEPHLSRVKETWAFVSQSQAAALSTATALSAAGSQKACHRRRLARSSLVETTTKLPGSGTPWPRASFRRSKETRTGGVLGLRLPVTGTKGHHFGPYTANFGSLGFGRWLRPLRSVRAPHWGFVTAPGSGSRLFSIPPTATKVNVVAPVTLPMGPNMSKRLWGTARGPLRELSCDEGCSTTGIGTLPAA